MNCGCTCHFPCLHVPRGIGRVGHQQRASAVTLPGVRQEARRVASHHKRPFSVWLPQHPQLQEGRARGGGISGTPANVRAAEHPLYVCMCHAPWHASMQTGAEHTPWACLLQRWLVRLRCHVIYHILELRHCVLREEETTKGQQSASGAAGLGWLPNQGRPGAVNSKHMRLQEVGCCPHGCLAAPFVGGRSTYVGRFWQAAQSINHPTQPKVCRFVPSCSMECRTTHCQSQWTASCCPRVPSAAAGLAPLAA